MEVFLKPEEYTQRIRSQDAGPEQDQVQEGDPTVTFCGERRSKQKQVSTTDPDATLANKGNGTAAMVGYTVNGLMENQHRLLLGINVESFRGPASETDGGRQLLDRSHKTHRLRIQTVGADTRYCAKPFLTALVRRRITPDIAADHRTRGRASAGETAEPHRGLPSLAAGTEEDRRAQGRGEMLAWVPAVSPPGAQTSPR